MYLQYCIYIYIYIHTHMYIHIYIYTRIYIHTYIYIYTHIYIRIYIYMLHVHTICCLICQPIGCFQQCQAPSIIPMSSIKGDTCGTRHLPVENPSFIDDFSIWPSIYRGFPIATFDDQRVIQIVDHNGYGWYPVSPTVGSSTTMDADHHLGKNMTIVLIHYGNTYQPTGSTNSQPCFWQFSILRVRWDNPMNTIWHLFIHKP